MSWDSAVGELKNSLPPFNDYLLKEYREEQINKFPEYIDDVFKEVTRLFGGQLEYKGYTVLPPEAKLEYNLSYAIVKGRVSILESELELISYMFEYNGVKIPLYLHVPYMYDGAIVIDGTKYFIPCIVAERSMSRIDDGVIIKVMRTPIPFYRKTQFKYTSTSGDFFYDAIITCKLHSRESKSKNDSSIVPVVLYLLSKFGFEHVRDTMFGLNRDLVDFVATENKGDAENYYFLCDEGIYLRVNKELMQDRTNRRFVASVVYILTNMKRYTIEDVYKSTIYLVRLGLVIHHAKKDTLAASCAATHLSSMDTALDKYTKEELRMLGIHCNDIYDLLMIAFCQIDTWIMRNSPNNLFSMRLGGCDFILKDFVKSVFTRVYKLLTKKQKDPDSMVKDYRSTLRMNVDTVCNTMISADTSRSGTQACNDNNLISHDIKRVRASGLGRRKSGDDNIINNKENQFHTSFAAVESISFVSQSNPGLSGDINPFLVINNLGHFLPEFMDWVKALSELDKYLVKL